MLDLMFTFLKAEELVLDVCFRTFGNANPGLQRHENHRFVECEKIFACFQDTVPSLVEAYGKHVLSSDSDLLEQRKCLNPTRC